MKFSLLEKEILICLPLAPLRALVLNIADDVMNDPVLGYEEPEHLLPHMKRFKICCAISRMATAFKKELGESGLILRYKPGVVVCARTIIEAGLTQAGYAWVKKTFWWDLERKKSWRK